MKKLSRNDPCWCGSGKKYKKCHLNSDLEKGLTNNLLKPPPGAIIKTDEQIVGIRKASQLTKDILNMVAEKIAPGISTEDINTWVHNYTIEHGGIPAPLNYHGFPKSVCTSVNDVICHGIPTERILKDGDIINVDVTSILGGYYGDASRMFFVGTPSKDARKLVEVARECLYIGIEQVKPNRDISEIGIAIEAHAKSNGFSIVRDYGGHGVGINFHEEPHIHHYATPRKGHVFIPNMTFTIEPMINQGKFGTRLLSDDWTAVTVDNRLSAQWEHTLLVTENGVEILSE